MLHKLEVLKDLANKNDYECTRIEKFILSELIPRGVLDKNDGYTLVEAIYSLVSYGYSLIDLFESRKESLSSKLDDFMKKHNRALQPQDYSTPIKIKEIPEDIKILEFRLKIRAIVMRMRKDTRVEGAVSNIFERISLIRNNVWLVTNYINNVEAIQKELAAEALLPPEEEDEE